LRRAPTDLERAEHLGEHVQLEAGLVEAREQGSDLGHRARALDLAEEILDACAVGCEGARQEQVLERLGGEPLEGVDDAGLDPVDAGPVHVAALAQPDQLAALAAQVRECADVGVDVLPLLRAQCREQCLDALLAGAQGQVGLGPQRLDLLELADGELRGLEDGGQARAQIVHRLVGEPVVVIRHPGRGGNRRLVGRPAGLLLLESSNQAEGVGDAADELGVSDRLEMRPGGRPACRNLFRGEGRLPDLHRVDAGRLAGPVAEDDHPAVREHRVPVAVDRALHLLADGVVGQEDVAAAPLLVEDEEHVLAVRGADATGELHALDVAVEVLAVPRGERVTARIDDAVVVRELDAGVCDRVDAMHAPGAPVEDEMAGTGLAVGPDAEQDVGSHTGEADLRVLERLVRVLDRLRVDPLSVLGVVLDLDREVSRDRLDEYLVEDRDVWMSPVDVVVAAGGRPLEVVGGGVLYVALAAVVDVRDAALTLDGEAEHLQVSHSVARRQRDQEPPVAALQPGQGRGLVVFEELVEVAAEVGVVQEGASGDWREVEIARPIFREAVQAEHVLDARLLAQPDEDVVAEEQLVADGYDVAGNAVVLGADPLAGHHAQLASAKELEPPPVELLRLVRECAPLLEEPGTHDLVGAVLEAIALAGGCLVGRLCSIHHRGSPPPRFRSESRSSLPSRTWRR
jgi:hypothetical protein